VWVRKGLKVAAGVVVAAPIALVIAFFVYAHHASYQIPARDQPPPELASGDGGVTLKYLGVTGYEISDGITTVLVDPTPTRPAPTEFLTQALVADDAYGKEVCPKADFILVNHTHFDHALDVPAIAVRTGATVVGSQSTLNYAQSRGVAAAKLKLVKPGDHLTLGTFTVDVRHTRHTAIGWMEKPWSGVIAQDAGPLRFWQFTMDQTLSFRFESEGTSLWFHPTSTFADGEIGGPPAPTLIVGVTGEKATPKKVQGLLAEAKPLRVLPTHYDNFFQPMQKGLALMPMLDFEAVRKHYLDADPKLTWVVLDYGQSITLPRD
jgi:L-ascorbate metabolism protein UlaG (beta-lactamase superfamily)